MIVLILIADGNDITHVDLVLLNLISLGLPAIVLSEEPFHLSHITYGASFCIFSNDI
ncbi:hypothetical protein BH18THE2_BH18THE2_29900 [soil metagenome]